jgi:arylsulfatase A-like enzyme
LLSEALDYVNNQIGAMVSEIHHQGLANSTTIIVSAKHGQSPTDPATLTRVPDAPIISGLNAAWAAAHPGASPLVVYSTDDDVMQLWLSDRSQGAADFAKAYLLSNSASGNDVNGTAKTVSSSGLTTVYAGAESANFFGVPNNDPRHPDVYGIVQHGVVYTGGKGKIAEHGGSDPQDRSVPILVSGADVTHHQVVDHQVETTQIAPTILQLLGLDPNQLQAVQIEHTGVLPGAVSDHGE